MNAILKFQLCSCIGLSHKELNLTLLTLFFFGDEMLTKVPMFWEANEALLLNYMNVIL
jgi:hypothetical protein